MVESLRKISGQKKKKEEVRWIKQAQIILNFINIYHQILFFLFTTLEKVMLNSLFLCRIGL